MTPDDESLATPDPERPSERLMVRRCLCGAMIAKNRLGLYEHVQFTGEACEDE